MEHDKLNRYVLIDNVITLIVFGVLAVVFHRWWIVLISILFFSRINKK